MSTYIVYAPGGVTFEINAVTYRVIEGELTLVDEDLTNVATFSRGGWSGVVQK